MCHQARVRCSYVADDAPIMGGRRTRMSLRPLVTPAGAADQHGLLPVVPTPTGFAFTRCAIGCRATYSPPTPWLAELGADSPMAEDLALAVSLPATGQKLHALQDRCPWTSPSPLKAVPAAVAGPQPPGLLARAHRSAPHPARSEHVGLRRHSPSSRTRDPRAGRADRNPAGHLAFGSGIHLCLGAQLARMEAQAVLRELVARVDRIEVTGTPAWSTNPNLRGLRRLNVRLTPRVPANA